MFGGGGGTGANWGGGGGTIPTPPGIGGIPGFLNWGGPPWGGPPPPRFSFWEILNANCKKNSLVSLFQRCQNLLSCLSTSLEGILKEMVSYGSAAKSRYCHLRSGGSIFCKGRSTLVPIVPKITARWRQMEFCIFCAKSRQNERSSLNVNKLSREFFKIFFFVKKLVKMKGVL